MKKTGKLCILLAVLATLTVGTFLAKNITASTAAETGAALEEESVTLSFLSDDADAFSCTYAGETLSFVRSDAGWTLKGEETFPLSQSSVEKMLSWLSNISVEKTLSTPDELSAYGLEDPECSVTAGDKTFSLGNRQDMDGYTYISLGDGNVYLVDSSVSSVLCLSKADLVENETLPSLENITSLQITTPDGAYEILHMQGSGIAYSSSYEYFLRTDGGDGYVTLDTELTEAFFSNIRNLTFSFCENWDADDAEMRAFGLDAPEVCVTVKHNVTGENDTGLTDSDGQPISEAVSVPQEFTLLLSGDYACLAGSRMVYDIGNTLSDTFRYTTAADLLPDEVLALDYSDVTAMTVQLDGEQFYLEKTAETAPDENGDTDIVIFWQTEGVTVDPDSFLQEIRSMLSYGAAGEYAAGGPEEFSVLFERSDPSYPVTGLSFRRYSSDNCLVLLDGEPTVFVRRSDVSSLADAFRNVMSEAGNSVSEAESSVTAGQQ